MIAYLITPEIRAWNRISIFIAFFALATIGLGLDAIGRRFFPARRGLALAGLTVILVFGIFDQSTRLAIPNYRATGKSYGSDSLFVAAIQREMPRNAAIFQLPYMPFPETPTINDMQDYDPLRGYVHATDLRWSYPSMTGRPTDWGAQTQSLPMTTLVDGVIAAGFSGIWVDRFGYADSGMTVIAELRQLLGAPPINSTDGRFAFFDLRRYATGLKAARPAVEMQRLRIALLHPLEDTWGAGFYGPEPNSSRWARPTARAEVVNPSVRPREAVFDAIVQTLAKGSYLLTVKGPGGFSKTVPISSAPRVVEVELPLPPDEPDHVRRTAPVTLAPGDVRSLGVHYGTPTISAAGMAPFLPNPGSHA